MKALYYSLVSLFLWINYVSPSHSHEHSIEDDVNQRLGQLGIVLPPSSSPKANYLKAVTAGKLVFLAGHGPVDDTGKLITGKLGKNLSIEQGTEAARLCGIMLLASLKKEIGDLNRVKRIVKVFGMVNATDDFTKHSTVINGFSDLMVEVFGEQGKHARAAVGMASLPANMAIEIDMIVELKSE